MADESFKKTSDIKKIQSKNLLAETYHVKAPVIIKILPVCC